MYRTLLAWVRRIPAEDVVYECRHCGTTLESELDECSCCGTRDGVVRYELR
ncbi:small CPxCG-related zinc finger protein [Natronomonas moolapensis 8.8.11]|uniref:Small CPxCG-related zinc finger protein n=1 Tax=Natronomonas moolapensis (strain DSM 18674 / CECT 7526 / JCM 14361 / 8.8.11) TaxID=268739 RepID=M1XTZ3_NATM8|nr:small CPxCG-related zinc finger protein [Natronomonas moolapensis]CCQ38023.1 small CPxCG-related zinc finger protein [Natronomonas moolapensis 8.8.11]